MTTGSFWMFPSLSHSLSSLILTASGAEANTASWTTEEQKLLEQALKTYPVSTPERWEKIAAAVPGRTKKDCMKRYKVSWALSLILLCVVSIPVCMYNLDGSILRLGYNLIAFSPPFKKQCSHVCGA